MWANSSPVSFTVRVVPSGWTTLPGNGAAGIAEMTIGKHTEKRRIAATAIERGCRNLFMNVDVIGLWGYWFLTTQTRNISSQGIGSIELKR